LPQSVDFFLAPIGLKIGGAQAVAPTTAFSLPSPCLDAAQPMDLERVRVLLVRPHLRWPLDLKEGEL